MKRLHLLLLVSAASALLLLSNAPVAETPENPGPPINGPLDEFYPSVTADGTILVFNTKRNSRYQDIYIARWNNGTWNAPSAITAINSPYNDETPFITGDGNTIIFASDRDGSLEMPRDEHGRIRVSFDLYWAKKVNGAWTMPARLPGGVNTMNHERAPSLSRDGNTLYYTTWPFGSPMDSRIMKAEYRDGMFSRGEALPSPINTGSQDMAIIPSSGGDGFYFSSRRGGGHGGWDLWFSSYRDGTFGTPVNLGPKVNTASNEFYFTRSAFAAYFCSDRPNGHGRYDIYSVGMKQKERDLSFLVRNKISKDPLSVDLKINQAGDTGEPAAFEKTLRTDRNGMARIKLPGSAGTLGLGVFEKDFLPYTGNIQPEEAEGKGLIIELTPLAKDASFDIHDIYFDYDSATIKKASHQPLNTLVDYMTRNPALKLEIIGHTDLTGGDDYNMKLSLSRARSVRDYLVEKGISPSRFEVKGAGKSKPLVQKTGPGFDEKNRRTEFRIIRNE